MDRIISDVDLTIDELREYLADKKNLLDEILSKFAFYDFKVINMHRGGHIISCKYDDDHLLFNLRIGEGLMIAMQRIEPRVIKSIDVSALSIDGKKAFSEKKFCQTGFWVYLDIKDNSCLDDLFYLVDKRIENLNRVNKKVN